ncbi:hypothetical protein KNP414_04770 [Paenibacillus mucilaginosus KNP414]|uniref:Uncharacterized protein n=1 Tax=Paenibacillus mucilaginosus (strain KNP414) TaxID=1036673 RepID=F8FG38_PAEMK|nr:hypothetical protein KNP414_04770 [Paenibacillus mucilaginosus KNP414]
MNFRRALPASNLKRGGFFGVMMGIRTDWVKRGRTCPYPPIVI